MSYVSLGQTRTTATATLAPLTVSTQLAKPPCASVEEKRQATLACKIPDVKGVGAALGYHYPPTHPRFPGLDACFVAQLPTCATPQVRMTLATPPSTTTLTRPPPPPPPATVTPIPSSVVAAFRMPTPATPVPGPTPVEPTKKFLGLGVGGLLAVLAVGGGAYLVLRKKKKAAS